MAEGVIAIDDPRAADVRELLGRHLTFARTHTPPEDVHALDLNGLLEPSVTFFSYRVSGTLLGFGALKELDRRHGEVKSMHTTQEARGRGIGRAILAHLVAVARQRGYLRMSLETGTMPAFAAARALYASAGFTPCEPFGDYTISPSNTWMTLALSRVDPGAA